MWRNINLQNAKAQKKDEFYTELSDIEEELMHYKNHFKWKTVYCNCDDPYESNFFKYFAMRFNALWLKKLIATSYSPSPIAHTQLNIFWDRKSYKIEVNEVYDANWDWAINLADVKYLLETGKWKNKVSLLEWDWDFRSDECIKILEEADIIVTNPPFSLFREYVAQLMQYHKKFIIRGNNNAIPYKEIFPYIKGNEIWLWYSVNKTYVFRMPNYYDKYDEKIIIEKNNWYKYWKVPCITIFTNLDIKKRHENIILTKKYSPDKYIKYDNFDWIDVKEVADIPEDYYWYMWVPITFVWQYNPDQFELIWIWTGDSAKKIWIKKNYRWRTDLAYTKDWKHSCPFSRVIIRRKK